MAIFKHKFPTWCSVPLIFFLATSALAAGGLTSQFVDVEKMKIYEYDDYDICRREYFNLVYCTVQLRLLPNASHMLWNSIRNYSSSPRHFDRRTIEVGVCLQECQPSLEWTIANVTTLLNSCLHEKIWSQYKLKYSLMLATCNGAMDDYANDEYWLIDIVRAVFISWVLGALLLVICATLMDTGFSRVSAKSHAFLFVIKDSFSLSRNLASLIKTEEKMDLNLRHLDGIRAITMMIILVSHSSIPLIRMPLKNVDQLEAGFNQIWFPIAMAGNTYTVQLFFVIGGLLLSVNIMQQTKNANHVDVHYFKYRVKNRLIRILPTYTFVILFHISVYPRLYDGPIGNRFKDHCANNWWTNLLFVNNYIHPSEPCIQFAWYLGADFQLFVLGTALMMLIRNHPKLTKSIITLMMLSAFLIPATKIYVYHLDATIMMILRYVLQEIRTLPYYTLVYIPFETNAGNYFFGMLAGFFYYKVKDNPATLEKVKDVLNHALLGSAIYFALMNGLTPLLPSDHLPYPSMKLAIFGSLLKIAWGIFPSTLLLHMALYNNTSMLASLLKHPFLLVASKLSYAVYLTQYGIIYTVYRHVTYPLMYDGFTILVFTTAIVTITFLISFLLYTVIEAPLNKMLKKML